MEPKQITVEIKHVYGREAIYPYCDDAKLFAKLVRQATLTRADIEVIKSLGYEIEIIQQKVRL